MRVPAMMRHAAAAVLAIFLATIAIPASALEVADLQETMRLGQCPEDRTPVSILIESRYCKAEYECWLDAQLDHEWNRPCGYGACIKDMNEKNKAIGQYNAWLRRACPRPTASRGRPFPRHPVTNARQGSGDGAAIRFERDFESIVEEAKRKSAEAAERNRKAMETIRRTAERLAADSERRMAAEAVRRQREQEARERQAEAERVRALRRLMDEDNYRPAASDADLGYPPGCRNKASYDECAIRGYGCSLGDRRRCAPICRGSCDD